jgi:hypothetical protein
MLTWALQSQVAATDQHQQLYGNPWLATAAACRSTTGWNGLLRCHTSHMSSSIGSRCLPPVVLESLCGLHSALASTEFQGTDGQHSCGCTACRPRPRTQLAGLAHMQQPGRGWHCQHPPNTLGQRLFSKQPFSIFDTLHQCPSTQNPHTGEPTLLAVIWQGPASQPVAGVKHCTASSPVPHNSKDMLPAAVAAVGGR